MFKNYFIVFILLIMGTGNGFGQYLTYQQMKELLNASENISEAKDFLETNEFEFEDAKVEDDNYGLEYRKFVGDFECIIKVFGDSESDTYSIGEYSWDVERWDYYNHLFHSEEYDKIDAREEEEGVFVYEFEGDDVYIIMTQKPEEDGTTLYKIVMMKY